jgi:hypothetical protein
VVVVDLVVAVAVTLVGADSRAVVVGSILADKPQVELAPGEVASASGERASEVALGTLRGQDLVSRRLGIHRMHRLRLMVLAHKLRVRQSQGSRISACPAFAITL